MSLHFFFQSHTYNIPYAGYGLSPTALNILFNRFARKRKYMGIDDFCSCLSRIKIMDGTYSSMSYTSPLNHTLIPPLTSVWYNLHCMVVPHVLIFIRTRPYFVFLSLLILDTYQRASKGGSSVTLSKDEVSCLLLVTVESILLDYTTEHYITLSPSLLSLPCVKTIKFFCQLNARTA